MQWYHMTERTCGFHSRQSYEWKWNVIRGGLISLYSVKPYLTHNYFQLAITYMHEHRYSFTVGTNHTSANNVRHNLMCGTMLSVCTHKLTIFSMSESGKNTLLISEVGHSYSVNFKQTRNHSDKARARADYWTMLYWQHRPTHTRVTSNQHENWRNPPITHAGHLIRWCAQIAGRDSNNVGVR